MTTQSQVSVRDMKKCNWAFLVKGPRSSLECLPSVSPWWSITFVNNRSEWEAFIPDHPHEADSNRQFDLAMQAITRMNGLAVSSGHPGLIEMTHLVAYDSENNRTVAIPLKLVITVTNLGGLGPTKPAAVDFSRIRPEKPHETGYPDGLLGTTQCRVVRRVVQNRGVYRVWKQGDSRKCFTQCP